MRHHASRDSRSGGTHIARALLAAGAFCAVFTAVALARTLTLTVARHATVVSAMGKTTHENIVVNARGFPVYELTGDSRSHPECTKASGCFGFWPPVTVASAHRLAKARGVSGKLGTWRRNGFIQVTLGGHPLYTFGADVKPRLASGEGYQSYGGTWHVVRAK